MKKTQRREKNSFSTWTYGYAHTYIRMKIPKPIVECTNKHWDAMDCLFTTIADGNVMVFVKAATQSRFFLLLLLPFVFVLTKTREKYKRTGTNTIVSR